MQERYVWIDIETSGLNARTDKILEVAIVVTDNELFEKARKQMVIKHPKTLLSKMNPWSVETHTKNGLLKEMANAKYPANIADAFMAEWLIETLGSVSKPYMCGMTVHFDREFLKRHMPRLESVFHYRNYDVATLREFFEANAPEGFTFKGKESTHRALDDIDYCVNALRHYRRALATACVCAGIVARDSNVGTAALYPEQNGD